MCGIAGFANLPVSKSRSKSLIKEMTDVIAHRGPDGEGWFIDGQYVLGNRRLAIIDLNTGNQPMSTQDGRFWITYNGEVYNFIELRKELKAKGYKFATKSDTEVILNMYRAYGPKCVSKFNGMFAFCIFDKKNKTFFAARDRFGIKPFYYYHRGKQFIFGSEIKALLKAKPNLAKLNKDGLSEYITFQFCLGEKTLFRHVKKLEPGHYLTYKNGSLKTKKYWDLDFSVDTHHTKDYFRDKLLWLLTDSVKLRLRSDVPVGAHLSGGLDSSTVTCLAAKYYPNKFKTFSGRFAKKGFDETYYAKLVNKFTNSKYFEITLRPKDFVDSIEKLIYFMDEPAAGPGLFPQYFVSKLAGKHLKVVLGGQGGDETFGGYARYLISYLEASLKGAIFETQRKEDPRFVVTFTSILENLPMLNTYQPLMQFFFAKGLFSDLGDRYFRLIDRGNGIRGLINKDFLPNKDDFGKAEFDKIFEAHDFGPLFNRMTYFDMKTLLPALLHVEDRMSMAASLESRTPLLDYRIAELVASMPAAMKYKNGESKHILKQAVRNKIPKTILQRKDKMGFPVPLTSWSKGKLKEYFEDILLGETAKQRGFYDVGGVEKILREERAFDRRIWGLLNLELWFRKFID